MGIALGLGSRAVDFLGLRWVGNIAAIWALVPFLVARRATDTREAIGTGVTTLVVAALAYYAWRVLLDGDISLYYLSRVGVLWLVGAVLIGGVAGWAGRRSVQEPLFWGLPAGVFLGEAAAVLLLSQRLAQVAVEIAAAGICCSSSRPQLGKGLFVTAMAGAAVAFVASVYRFVLR